MYAGRLVPEVIVVVNVAFNLCYNSMNNAFPSQDAWIFVDSCVSFEEFKEPFNDNNVFHMFMAQSSGPRRVRWMSDWGAVN